jgi:threonine dehydrogenase-like Zn-dependent dehydrogenase
MTALTAAAMSITPSRVRTMRAAVVQSPGVAEVVQTPLPEPSAGQVRVRLEGCGVCASNVPPWEGREWFQYPMAPGALGHEAWGVVDEVGEGVTRFTVGDRVGLLSNNAYAEYDVSGEDQMVLLPQALGGKPFPAEPLGCAMNIFARADVRAGQTVAVVGVGFLGAILCRLAADAGARVIAVARKSFALDVAKRMGAHELVPMDDHWKVIHRDAELTNGSGGYDVRGFCDRVVECTGKQWPLDLSAELCAVRAKLVVAGYHQDGLRQVNLQLWNWRGLDVVNAHERDPQVYLSGMRAAVDAVASGKLDPGPLYTHTFPLERLGEALDMTKARPEGFMKALVTM